MENYISIFDVERRVNPIEEYLRLLKYICNTRIRTVSVCMSFYSYIDKHFIEWKFRDRALSIEDYLKILKIDMYRPYTDVNALCGIELFYNLSIWIKEYAINNGEAGYDVYNDIIKVSTHVRENVKSILEGLNMKDVKQEKYKYIFCKRDEDVDSVLEYVPDISSYLLGYLDFRRQKDILYKQGALKCIADYLEPRRNAIQNSNYKGLCDTVFFAFNNFRIRHDNNKQIRFNTDEEMIAAYDKTFKLALHLIRAEMAIELKNEIDKYKPK